MKFIFTQIKAGYLLLIACAFVTFLLPQVVYAQNPQQRPKTLPAALNMREISGIVKDSTDVGLPGVTIRLTSEKDTLITSTNSDGIFIFKNVKMATYTLSLTMLGYKQQITKYKQNDAISRIVMDPIILQNTSNTLKEIEIKGSPSITYKTDTVEYKASDYIVRENATVDELLKKMEGMEVGNDGSLIHQGNNVTKAKINGKTYSGGEVNTAIQNLPAAIVDKIQIVDDYGDQAARTGIKDGDPQKVLNIVTRTDKSVGNTANIAAGAGNNKRYEGSAFGTRINGNQNITANFRLNNTVTGVANSSSGNIGGGGMEVISIGGQGGGGPRMSGGNTGGGAGSSGGSGGTTTTGNASFSYRDQLGKRVQINTNYSYNYNNSTSLNSSVSTIVGTDAPTYSANDSKSTSNSKNHRFSFELEADLDSNNFLRVTPEISLSNSLNGSNFSTFQTGFIHQDQIGGNNSTNKNPSLGITAFYQHVFKKPRRNFSLQVSLNSRKQESDQERNSNIIYYANASNTVVKDSLVHRIVERDNLTKNYRASVTFTEPLSANTQFEFNGQINHNGYDNTAITSNINHAGVSKPIDSLSNIYDYSFTQARLAFNYRYGLSNTSKVRFSAGLTAVPGVLSGTKVSLGTTTHRNSFNLIPIARFQYMFSRQHSIQVNYSGNATEPTFDQIQPVRDVSNPQNPVVGNPDLKVTFNHSVNLNYNNYLANQKLNYSIGANVTFIDNSVVRNRVTIPDSYGSFKYETRFLNMNGAYRAGGNYSISKQFYNRKYNLSYSGNISYNNGVAQSNDIKNITQTWNVSQRFGPRINPTEWMEVNPSVSYTLLKSNNTLDLSEVNTKTWALNIDGRFYMWQTLIFGYSASKNFVSGIRSNLTSNPLVINAYMQKELWKRRATVSLQAFDILKQNNFVNVDVNGLVTTETKSNALSRYFMLKASVRLQKWTGARARNGMQIRRRGDGSFY